MRILHTSDWHLGQHFIGKSRQAEHQKFTQWLLEKVEELQIDAVIIAGDVFDTGTPPSYARELYNQFVVELNKVNCRAVILAGNHDSVATLNESRELLAYMNTHVVANVSQFAEQQVFTVKDRAGNPGAIICAVPFVRPRDVISSQAGQSSVEKSQALGKAIYEHYQMLFSVAEELRNRIEKETGITLPIIATGHLTAMGVKTTESVRDIYIGSLEAFPASHFPQADYIALGHIHRPQTVAKTDHIRYCGSPIPLSFDELKWQKQVLLVEFTEQCLTPEISSLPIPLFQPMAVLKGNLNQIETLLNELEASQLPVWLSIEVETEDYLSDLQNRIESMVADRNAEVLLLRRSRKQAREQLSQAKKETLSELNPFQVFERRLANEIFEGEILEQRLEQIRQDFAAIVDEVASEQGITLSREVSEKVTDDSYLDEQDSETEAVPELAEEHTCEPSLEQSSALPESLARETDDTEALISSSVPPTEGSSQEGLFELDTKSCEVPPDPVKNVPQAKRKRATSKRSQTTIGAASVIDQTDLFSLLESDQEDRS